TAHEGPHVRAVRPGRDVDHHNPGGDQADAAGSPVQLIDPARPVRMLVRDLRGVDDASTREDALADVLREDGLRPVGLGTGPMLRALLVRLADEECVLAVTVHHIAFDGWSVGVLVRELSARYAEAVSDRSGTSGPGPLRVQYADYAVWQRAWLSGTPLERQLAYWTERLAGLEPLELPTDHARPAERGGRGEVVRFSVPAEVAARARAVSAESGASLFMTLLAAFQLLLARYSGQRDIAVGTPIAGRNRAETEDLIGFFVNTLVLRTDLSGDPTFTELLDRVKDTALGAYDHQDLPFERLVEELAPDRDLSRNPLFQTMFVLQNTPDGHAWRLPGTVVEPFAVRAEEAKFDLTLFLTERPDGSLDGDLVFALDLFAPDTAERLSGHFTTLLRAAVTGPERRLSELEVLAGAERRRVLADWSGTEAAADTGAEAGAGATVHRLVE
ncbi:condensation domain-containing protein, partial [Streptomyces olivaceoviridis]